MKKLLAVLVALFMLVPVALAEEIDLTKMTTEELEKLQQNIVLELISRGVSTDNVILKGLYVVGKDIKAGKYQITALDENPGQRVFLFPSEESLKAAMETKVLPKEAVEYNPYNSAVYITFEDGAAFVVEGSSMMIKEAKPSWAP